MITEALATAALAVAGWSALQVIKVPSLEDKVDHLVERVDAVYDHLLGIGPEKGRRGRG
jgi:hypothetical protein